MQIKPSHAGIGHPAILLQTAKKYLGWGGFGGRATVFYFAENFRGAWGGGGVLLIIALKKEEKMWLN